MTYATAQNEPARAGSRAAREEPRDHKHTDAPANASVRPLAAHPMPDTMRMFLRNFIPDRTIEVGSWLGRRDCPELPLMDGDRRYSAHHLLCALADGWLEVRGKRVLGLSPAALRELGILQ